MKLCIPMVMGAVFAVGTVMAASAMAATVPVAEWGEMKSVGEDGELIYEFNVPADSPLTVTCQYTPSAYTPTKYGDGYVSPGWFFIDLGDVPAYEGNVIMEMQKLYGESYEPSDAKLLIGGAGRGSIVGNYVPGATYDITMVWDRPNDEIDITVGSYHAVVDSQVQPIEGLVFQGPDHSSVGTSMFGNVTVAIPEPGTLALLSLGAVALIRRTR